MTGDRLLAYDVSTLGRAPAINVEGNSGRATYDGTLGDLERLGVEGFVETERNGRTLYMVVLRKAWQYRDWLRNMNLPEHRPEDTQRPDA